MPEPDFTVIFPVQIGLMIAALVLTFLLHGLYRAQGGDGDR